jgi:hypothetical protein
MLLFVFACHLTSFVQTFETGCARQKLLLNGLDGAAGLIELFDNMVQTQILRKSKRD